MARPKHRTTPGATYFVTTDTWQRRRVFLKATAAELVEKKFFEYRDKGAYLVHRYVVMPDHFHAILTPGDTTSLEKALGLLKGGSSFEIGKALQGGFPVWHEGFTEHQIRDQADFESHVRYIDNNPVKARLAERPEDYSFCSAPAKYRLDPWPGERRLASGAKALL
jgi:putative transposase